MQTNINYKKTIVTICLVLFAANLVTSCKLIAFAPYKCTSQQLVAGDSVVLVSLVARRA